ncbi:MAG: hypothetical protein M3Q50_11110 [Chloroflexota bacterium]|nr:hypothetical protein [Chloroflexia bacterium]MDQ3227165.1 hypothetical protein [Chloroflexota bacterium]
MAEERNPLATALGTYYPRHYVVAVLRDPAAATKALTALQGEGFAEAEAEICPGPDFIRNWNDFAAHRGKLARIANLFPAEERSAVEEYLAEAENGASFVTVHATTTEERNRARDLLRPFGAYGMRYYGDRTITDLE